MCIRDRVELCDPPVTHGPYLSTLEIGHYIKCCINSPSSLLRLLYLSKLLWSKFLGGHQHLCCLPCRPSLRWKYWCHTLAKSLDSDHVTTSEAIYHGCHMTRHYIVESYPLTIYLPMIIIIIIHEFQRDTGLQKLQGRCVSHISQCCCGRWCASPYDVLMTVQLPDWETSWWISNFLQL